MSMAMFMAERPRMVADEYGPRPGSAWRRTPWRDHLRHVEVDGRRVNVVDTGPADAEGPPIVLVHGLGANWQSWLENIPVLAERHRVMALDLPGFGLSEMPTEQLSITGMARCVLATMDALGIDTGIVVGNSMGGFVGAEMALVAPERVEKLVLVSAAALWSEQLTARPTVVLNKLARSYSSWFYGQWKFAWRHPRLRLPALAGAGIRHPGAIPSDLAFELMQGAGTDGFADAVEALYDYRIRDRLPEIACPTLVVWGSHDPLVPVWYAFEYEDLIPHARVVVFRDTGHAPMLERPDRFNHELEQFIGELGVGAADHSSV
jgi:pimeloyl-ACP methyl ester carboxylesterase